MTTRKSKAEKVLIVNDTKRLITLKGQVKNQRGDEPRRFKSVLQPGPNLIPEPFWLIYKDNPVVEQYLEDEDLLDGPRAVKSESKKAPVVKKNTQEQEEAKTLAMIEGGTTKKGASASKRSTGGRAAK